MATSSIEVPHGATGRARRLVAGATAGGLVLAAAVPVLFVHERYQPTVSFDVSGTTVDVRLSDLAVLAVLLAALAAVRAAPGRLAPARILWITGALLLGWLALQALRPASLDDARFEDHLVSYLKLVEYGLLAVAVPLVVRRSKDLTLLLGSAVLWGTLAAAVAVLQFVGWDVFDAWNPGWRQPSFLGHHDLAALAAIVTGLAVAGVVVARARIPAPGLFPLAVAAGAVGLVLAGSVAAAGGLIAGAALVRLAAGRRFSPTGRQTLALVALVAVVGAGVVTVRDSDLGNFLRFVGLRGETQATGVESYSQRTVLAYIGLRIFEDNPVVGVGWQRSSRPEVFEPYVEDARERFPDVVELAFPAAGREWGVQNLYVQMLADAGVIGLALLLAVGAAGLVLAVRTIRHAPHPWAAGAGLVTLGALLTLAGEWASLGIVAGIPLQAATCLVLGLAAAGAALVEEESAG